MSSIVQAAVPFSDHTLGDSAKSVSMRFRDLVLSFFQQRSPQLVNRATPPRGPPEVGHLLLIRHSTTSQPPPTSGEAPTISSLCILLQGEGEWGESWGEEGDSGNELMREEEEEGRSWGDGEGGGGCYCGCVCGGGRWGIVECLELSGEGWWQRSLPCLLPLCSALSIDCRRMLLRRMARRLPLDMRCLQIAQSRAFFFLVDC